MPMRDWWDEGVMVTACSDNPVVSYDPEQPLLGYYMAVTGDTEAGVLLLGQELSRSEALKAYTWNNAFATFEEVIKGSIEPGKLADLVVLSDDILKASAETIPKMKIMMTGRSFTKGKQSEVWCKWTKGRNRFSERRSG
jgi:predicted amidohydrolase YtcJ